MDRFDHYVAVDWAQRNMAIARMTARSGKITTVDVPASVKDLQVYLGELHGKVALTLEESTASQWLYTELKSHVHELIVCDPYRNHLLKEGAKTDKADAEKLVRLLRGGLLKPVFHSGDEFIYMRKLVSGYIDLVKSGVRLKNQRAALFRANGIAPGKGELEQPAELFVVDGLERGIASYQEEKLRYESEFSRLCKKHKMLRLLVSIPGIAEIGAMKVASRIVDPHRFPTKGAFLSYCGLIRLDQISGGRSYGTRTSRHCPMLKEVFKTAALTATVDGVNHSFRHFYQYLMREKGYPEHQARHAVARRVAVLTWGVIKSGKPFKPNPEWRPPSQAKRTRS